MIKRQNRQMLTRDGFSLNQLNLVIAVPVDRHVLSLLPLRKGSAGPAFRSEMQSLDLADLIVDALLAEGYGSVEVLDLAADSHRGRPAVRLNLVLTSEEGLNYRGLFVGSTNGQRLDYALYLAPSEYFWDRDIGDVEQMIAQLR